MWRAIAMTLLAAAACGDDGVVTVLGQDGGADACPSVSQCNPLAPAGEQGCPAGDKCSALILGVSPLICPDAVAMGCAPAGIRAIGEACVWTAPAGSQSGYDNCVAGALCASDGVCRDICGFGARPEEQCAAGLDCFAMPGRFEPQGGGDPQYGACAPPL